MKVKTIEHSKRKSKLQYPSISPGRRAVADDDVIEEPDPEIEKSEVGENLGDLDATTLEKNAENDKDITSVEDIKVDYEGEHIEIIEAVPEEKVDDSSLPRVLNAIEDASIEGEDEQDARDRSREEADDMHCFQVIFADVFRRGSIITFITITTPMSVVLDDVRLLFLETSGLMITQETLFWMTTSLRLQWIIAWYMNLPHMIL